MLRFPSCDLIQETGPFMEVSVMFSKYDDKYKTRIHVTKNVKKFDMRKLHFTKNVKKFDMRILHFT